MFELYQVQGEACNIRFNYQTFSAVTQCNGWESIHFVNKFFTCVCMAINITHYTISNQSCALSIILNCPAETSSIALTFRIWFGSRYVGCWSHHLHPAMWLPSIPKSRSQTDGTFRIYQSRRIWIPGTVLG